MKNIYISLIAIALGSVVNVAQAEKYGVVNFNVGDSPVQPTNAQNSHSVTLYGCETKVDVELKWGENNQMLAFVPYGEKKSTTTKSNSKSKPKKNSHYVSKYYLVSPPMPLPQDQEDITTLGLLTPDTFVFTGEKPAQIVGLDYNVIKPLYLRYLPVDYDYRHDNEKSCKEMGIDTVVINTSCPDLPWKNGALGGSGIGVINNSISQRKIFIPTHNRNGTQPKQCSVTILDDIIPNEEVSFLSGNKLKKTIDLTKAYIDEGSLRLVCKPRTTAVLPVGCRQ